MPEQCIIPPVGEPIHIEEAKLDRRVSDAADDGRIRSLIAAARQAAEMQTRRQLLHARWKLTLDQFPMAGMGTPLPFRNVANIPSYAIMLPHSPLAKVVSIQYLDMAGVLQTMPESEYVINQANEPALITPCFGKIWPIALPQIGAVNVTYDAGYASPIRVATTGRQFTVSGPVTWIVGDRVQFYCSGASDAALPAPLDAELSYLIDGAPGSGVYTVSDSAGAPITFTTTGAGTGKSYIGIVPDGIRSWMLLRVGALYENREEVSVAQRVTVQELPYVSGLLDPYRTDMP